MLLEEDVFKPRQAVGPSAIVLISISVIVSVAIEGQCTHTVAVVMPSESLMTSSN